MGAANPTDGSASADIRRIPPRRPALMAALAVGAGIGLDRWLGLSLTIWLALAAGTLFAAVLASRLWFPRVAATLTLLALIAAGGAREHCFWSVRPADSILAFISSEPALMRLEGTIATPVEIRESPYGPRIPAWMEIDRSTCEVNVDRVQEGGAWNAASGRLRMDITGHLVHARAGDRIDVIGKLSFPAPPLNPGQPDYRDMLRVQGLDGLLRVEHPAAVTRLGAAPGMNWTLVRLREGVRSDCRRLFVNNLKPPYAGLAASLLLGDRTLMTDETSAQFAETGTMHLLAISGLHVTVLLGLMLLMCRLLNWSARSIAVALILTVVLYAFVTNHRPPVMRAAAMATLALTGTAWGRRVDGWNVLGASALGLMLWRPSDLFDVGAQLSFLAVGAILWEMQRPWRITQADAGPDALTPEQGPVRRWTAAFWGPTRDLLTMTGAIWLATLPLTVAVFHLAAPIGLVINLLLIPFSAVVLGTGYLFLIGALLVPISSGILARPFLESLWLQQSLVAWGQGFPAGHVYLPTVPEWWIVGFYLLLAVGWQLIGTRRTAYWGTCGVLLWTLLLLAAPLLPRPQGPLRCTFLSVGHGLAAVIELPTGETLLYDAGAIGDGLRAERAVENYLWSRGKRSVDAVILSHGDHDHYSGLFGLVEKLPVGALLIGQRFPDPSQRGTMDVCELAAAQGAPIRCLQAGDELRLTGSTSQPVSMKILHPAGGFQSPADNAHSLVLELSYAQRTILLTGDLEKEGLIALLKQPQRQVDVLLAPHHGGKAANVPELYAWARPGMVVVSSGEPSSQRLTQVAEPAELFNTATSGAVTVEIGAHGRVRADEFAPPADR